jgi:hypothetical protein
VSAGLSPAARTRLASAALVGAWLAAARLLQPDPALRATLHYAVVASLGYGHLLGATRLGRAAAPGHGPGVGRALLAGAPVVLVASFAPLYGALAARWPGVIVAALAASVWHAVENDLALPAALRSGPRLGPLPRSARAQLPAVGLAAVAAAAGALALADRLPVAFGDLFAGAMLHHLVSWLLVVRARQRALARSAPAAARRFGRRLLALHAAPVLAAGALAAAPDAAAGRLLAPLFAPPLYLFFSAAHVAATTRARGLAPRGRAA